MSLLLLSLAPKLDAVQGCAEETLDCESAVCVKSRSEGPCADLCHRCWPSLACDMYASLAKYIMLLILYVDPGIPY